MVRVCVLYCFLVLLVTNNDYDFNDNDDNENSKYDYYDNCDNGDDDKKQHEQKQ